MMDSLFVGLTAKIRACLKGEQKFFKHFQELVMTPGSIISNPSSSLQISHKKWKEVSDSKMDDVRYFFH